MEIFTLLETLEDILENNNKSSDDVNEIIVVDDCSTDESTKIVKEYTKKL